MLMRISHIKQVFPLIAAYVGIVTGCTPSLSPRPNSPYQGPFPDSFHILELKNPLLATESARLPEIHDGISDSEKAALEKIGQLYLRDPDSFDAAFKEMYRIGKPAVRKYCAPLQAIYWLAEDGNLTDQNNPLINYSLNTLLITAWQVDYCKPGLTDEQVLKVIEGLQDQNIRNHYRLNIKNGIDEAIVDTIFEDYRKNPKKFSRPTQKIISQPCMTPKEGFIFWITPGSCKITPGFQGHIVIVSPR